MSFKTSCLRFEGKVQSIWVMYWCVRIIGNRKISKTADRSCRIFRIVNCIPPCYHIPKNRPNFFSIGPILMKKFLVVQKHSLCLFSKKNILSLSVSHQILVISWKITLFLAKILNIGGEQTNSKIFSKMQSLDPGNIFLSPKCYNISKNDDFVFSQSCHVSKARKCFLISGRVTSYIDKLTKKLQKKLLYNSFRKTTQMSSETNKLEKLSEKQTKRMLLLHQFFFHAYRTDRKKVIEIFRRGLYSNFFVVF